MLLLAVAVVAHCRSHDDTLPERVRRNMSAPVMPRTEVLLLWCKPWRSRAGARRRTPTRRSRTICRCTSRRPCPAAIIDQGLLKIMDPIGIAACSTARQEFFIEREDGRAKLLRASRMATAAAAGFGISSFSIYEVFAKVTGHGWSVAPRGSGTIPGCA